MIVSYKDRDEDRRRGLEAGAAYYLTKASFHDDKLLQAVVDLIGEADGVRIGIIAERPSSAAGVASRRRAVRQPPGAVDCATAPPRRSAAVPRRRPISSWWRCRSSG